MSTVNEETKPAPSSEAPSEAPASSDATAAEETMKGEEPEQDPNKDDGAVVDDKAGDKSGGDNVPASGETAAPPPVPAAAAPAPGPAATATAVPPPVAPGYGMPAYYAGAWPYGACGAVVPANPPAVTPPGSYGAGGALLGPFPNQMGGYTMPGGMMFPGAMVAAGAQQYQQPQPHPYAAATNATAAAVGGMVPNSSDDGTAHPAADVRAAAQEQERKKRRKKPKDKPRRPLSAYNLFFKDERAKILAQIPGKDRSDLDSLDAEGDAKKARTDQPKGKKVPHGKIGFESLAKEIGGRWKELPPDRLEHYKKLADEDTERYTREMEEYFRRVQSAKETVAALASPAPLPSGPCYSYGAPAAAGAGPVRVEAQRIVNHVFAETGSSGTAAGIAAGKKRGRRPRDSLLDPEALEAWKSQCKHAMASEMAAASAAASVNAEYYQAQAAAAAAMAGAAMAGGYPQGMTVAPYMGGGWPMAGGFVPHGMMSPMAAVQQGTGGSGGGSGSKKDSGNGTVGKKGKELITAMI